MLYHIRNLNKVRKIIFYKSRKFSMNKDEGDRSAELGGLLSPKMKKYAIIIVPTVISLITAVDIINNINHRNILEAYVPYFVHLVREYHGFDDEDLNEIKRVKYVIEQQNIPITITISMNNNLSNKIENINPNQTIDTFIDTIMNDYSIKNNIDINNLNRCEILRNISFDDANINQHINEINTKEQNNNNNMSNNIDNKSIEDSNSNCDIILKPTLSLYSSLYSSLNNQNLINQSTSTSYYINPLINEYHIGLQTKINSQFTGNKYIDFLSYMVKGLEAFELYGLSDIPVKGNSTSIHIQNNRKYIRKSATTWFKSADSNNKNVPLDISNYQNDKILALQKIDMIEKDIKDLEREKLYGRRAIDDIDSDIKIRKNEIIELQRKYLNFFYYF